MSSQLPIYVNKDAAQAHTHSRESDFDSTKTKNRVKQFHKSLPNYTPSALIRLPDLAKELGVSEVLVKYEGDRLGLPSFKILGASWGCYRSVVAYYGLEPTVSLEELSTRVRSEEKRLTLVAATDGNHGRAVAFMARLLGAQAKIFVPDFVNEMQCGRIANEGADVVVIHGDYDQAVQTAWHEALVTKEKIMVQDNAFEGYEEVPKWIVEGYSTLLSEMEEQLSQLDLSATLVVTPVGVGSLAHAVVRYSKSSSSSGPLFSIATVESDSAPCLYTSLRAGKLVSISTSTTIMDGLNCGTVSSIAWPELRDLVDVSVTVSSYECHRAVQDLASCTYPVNAGPCGAAPLAAMRRFTADGGGDLFHKDSVVVLLCTEGKREYQIPHDTTRD